MHDAKKRIVLIFHDELIYHGKEDQGWQWSEEGKIIIKRTYLTGTKDSAVETSCHKLHCMYRKYLIKDIWASSIDMYCV